MKENKPTAYRVNLSDPPQEPPTILDNLILSFQRSLLARDLSNHTLISYLSGVRHFVAYLKSRGLPLDPEHISREHVELHMRDFLMGTVQRTGERPTSKTVRTRYRVLKIFFNWLVEMDEIKRSPMERMSPPKLEQRSRPVLSASQVRAILKACEGKAFADRRDYALVMLFIDTGLRLTEMASIRLDDIDWNNQAITIRKGKGRKARIVYFGKRTLKALDQYINLKGGRRDHRCAYMVQLWLGHHGAMSDAGIYTALKRRGSAAGVPGLHPHLWRHYFIHTSLKAGASPGDLMRQTGHSSIDQLLKYGEAAADERARESHRRLGPGDNL